MIIKKPKDIKDKLSGEPVLVQRSKKDLVKGYFLKGKNDQLYVVHLANYKNKKLIPIIIKYHLKNNRCIPVKVTLISGEERKRLEQLCLSD